MQKSHKDELDKGRNSLLQDAPAAQNAVWDTQRVKRKKYSKNNGKENQFLMSDRTRLGCPKFWTTPP